MREFKFPDPGEGLTEADLVTWRVAVGDTVKVNDIVVEVETAKSIVELPIPYAGVVAALLVDEGATVEVGTPIIVIDDGSGGSLPSGGGSAAAQGPGAAATGAAPTATPGAPEVRQSETVAGQSVTPQPAGSMDQAGSGAAAAPAKLERTPVLVGYGVKHTEAKRRPRRKAQLLQTVAHYPDEEPAVKQSVYADASSGVGELVAAHSTHVLRDRRPLTELTDHSPEVQARMRALAKPPVRKLAKDLGVDLVDIAGSGDGGVITREDVLAAAGGATDGAGAATSAATAAGAGTSGPRAENRGAATAYGNRGEERMPIKGVRKVTAAAMVGSAFTAPHVTEWVDRRRHRDHGTGRPAQEGQGVPRRQGHAPARARQGDVLAVRRNPEINAVWDEAAQEIVVKHYVNLGIAAATPRGLIVPNIKDADLMTMHELAAAIGALTTTAREGQARSRRRCPAARSRSPTSGCSGSTPARRSSTLASRRSWRSGRSIRKPWVVTNSARRADRDRDPARHQPGPVLRPPARRR
jgi:2-oxoisovalerate dehydrogenase E2 component (dihydrolipoyl transacylase)